MPIRYAIDDAAGIVAVTAEGDVRQEEDLECFGALVANPGYRPGMGLLLDYRNRVSVATTEQVKQFVEAAARLREAFDGSRCAIVVSEDVAFGMARMYAALAEDSFIPMNVFRDPDEAARWLASEPPDGNA